MVVRPYGPTDPQQAGLTSDLASQHGPAEDNLRENQRHWQCHLAASGPAL